MARRSAKMKTEEDIFAAEATEETEVEVAGETEVEREREKQKPVVESLATLRERASERHASLELHRVLKVLTICSSPPKSGTVSP